MISTDAAPAAPLDLPTDDLLAADPPVADLPVEGAELAAFIAGKLCHDFISPSGAIVSGLDLMKDPSAQDMRDDALALIEQSARKMVALVHFAPRRLRRGDHQRTLHRARASGSGRGHDRGGAGHAGLAHP
ncbi:hypothetical protein [Brevundimonas sp. SORGH_AS_0993]|uniref:hypothetical protein n=1 Tax=Brevundimonas sp. SORGH_AS_0993 TaxID=3041794 RepID=UPI0027843E88|nr:hypothetical protein [Brevundimonas sp. SORGH_AS_0993]MDQ1155140.1 hypothetical protein [Brevundimonas sp. SORGH_AS_0993]